MPTLLEKIVYRADRWLKSFWERADGLFPRRSFRHFGLREALLYARQIDFWCRLSRVVPLVREALPAGGTVLDVGSGRQGLGEAARRGALPPSVRVVASDLDPARLRRGVASDAAFLPFRDRSFDAVVSMDMIEHCPAERRPAVLRELRRVARSRVIVTFPTASASGRFDGERADREFQDWHVRTLGYPEGNTAEHLAGAYPVLETVLAESPGRIEGLSGLSAWKRYMRVSHTRIGWVLAGLEFAARLRQSDARAPFHSCLVTWDL